MISKTEFYTVKLDYGTEITIRIEQEDSAVSLSGEGFSARLHVLDASSLAVALLVALDYRGVDAKREIDAVRTTLGLSV